MSRSGDVPRVGVAGWPVAHSRSPILHGYWLRQLGVAGRYEQFAVPPGEFEQFAARIGGELLGSNVTAPHKEAAFAACDRRTQAAEALGAVNTLWRDGPLLWGDNTDVEGFLTNMDEGVRRWAERSRSAVVIGAGGAARAVAYALVSRGVGRIAIVNRTPARAAALAERFGRTVMASSWDNLSSELSKADLLVNASSLGMQGQAPLDIDLRPLPPRAVVSDVVYVPLRTPLVEAARARGLAAVEGLGMLLHQAVPGFERWFGRRPEVTAELRALVEADIRDGRQEKQ
ncbi:MAG TPA: shikimate dehydrogenase [Roseiarcus sp.]|nr:shikimate dehydrogenase [Roseiarcus sp.]